MRACGGDLPGRPHVWRRKQVDHLKRHTSVPGDKKRDSCTNLACLHRRPKPLFDDSVLPLIPDLRISGEIPPEMSPFRRRALPFRIQRSHGTSLAFQRVEANFEGKEAV